MSKKKKTELRLHFEVLEPIVFENKEEAEEYVKSLQEVHGDKVTCVQMFIVSPFILNKE